MKLSLVKKVWSWLIALLGLWEFGDIAALFVPDFGTIPAFVWNHIIVGLVLMIAGIWAALTRKAGTAKTMSRIAGAASVWLLLSSFILRYPLIGVGVWNDLSVGVLGVVLGILNVNR